MWAKQKVDLDTSNRRTDSPRAPPQEPARRELLLAGRCWVGECRPESGDLLSVCDVPPPFVSAAQHPSQVGAVPT